MRSVDDKFPGSVQTYGCHSTLHALPLNAPATAHNDTLYLRMMCLRRPGVNQVGEKKKVRRGPALARVYCLRDSGWRQALKKQELKNTLFWWGGCFCGFVIAIAIRGPDRFPGREGRRGEKGMLFHTVHKGREQTERKRCGCLAVCLSAPFPPFSLLLSALSTPSIQATADSG